MIYPPIFRGVIPTATTQFVGVPMGPQSSLLYLDIQWRDAVSAATITLQSTGTDAVDAPYDVAGPAWVWKDEAAVPIAGPTAVAAASTKIHASNLGAARFRLKIVTTAQCDFEIYSGRK